MQTVPCALLDHELDAAVAIMDAGPGDYEDWWTVGRKLKPFGFNPDPKTGAESVCFLNPMAGVVLKRGKYDAEDEQAHIVTFLNNVNPHLRHYFPASAPVGQRTTLQEYVTVYGYTPHGDRLVQELREIANKCGVRDIKEDNVGEREDGTPVIIDFDSKRSDPNAKPRYVETYAPARQCSCDICAGG